MSPSEKILLPDTESESLEHLKNGMVEIGIGFMNSETGFHGSVHLLKQSINSIIKNDVLGEQLTDRLRLALSDISSKHSSKRSIEKRGRY